MKKHYLDLNQFIFLFSILIFSNQAFSQQFSFQLMFEDAVGNQDSLIIGYDMNGTNDIDLVFNEENIINLPLNSTFDVRISNEWQNRYYNTIPGTFHTKKQIIETACDSWFSLNCIDIYSNNWPVTITWDSTLFDNECLNGSVFTSITPGGWWDTGGFRAELLASNSYTFSPNFDFVNENYSYINDSGDTLNVFWLQFADSTLLSAQIEENYENQISIFQDIVNNVLVVKLDPLEYKVEKIELFDLTGKLQETNICDSVIDISKIESGMYFINIIIEDRKTINRKIYLNQFN